MRRAFVDLTKEELKNNPESHVFLGDISVGAFLNSDEQLIERVHNMGIIEQAIVGFASGVSLVNPGGNITVHTIAAFLVERAFEQIKLCCGYNQAKLLIISANGPYDYEKLGPTHHCPSDVVLMSTVPHLNIRVPATVDDLREAYQFALNSSDSTYIRLTSRAATVPVAPTVLGEFKRVSLSDGVVSSEQIPTDNAVVCVGEGLAYALKHWKGQATVYWTANPYAELPAAVCGYENITVIEPYTRPMIDAPRHAVRKYFKTEHKKIIQSELGWSDFE